MGQPIVPWCQITLLNSCGLSVLAVSTHFFIFGRRLPRYTLSCSKSFSRSFLNLHGHFIVKLMRVHLVDLRVFISKIDVIRGFGVSKQISGRKSKIHFARNLVLSDHKSKSYWCYPNAAANYLTRSAGY